MRFQTDKAISFSIVLLLGTSSSAAQLVQSNPGEYAEWGAGTAELSSEIKNEVQADAQTLGALALMGVEYDKISTWEREYSKYLSTIQGYASAVYGASTLAAEGVDLCGTVVQLAKAVYHNPDGLVASAVLSKVYIQLVQQLISIKAVYDGIVDKENASESKNRLTGPQRSEAMWTAVDNIRALKKRLKKIGLAVTFYNMADWKDQIVNSALNNINRNDIASMHSREAREALNRWKRCAKLAVDNEFVDEHDATLGELIKLNKQ